MDAQVKGTSIPGAANSEKAKALAAALNTPVAEIMAAVYDYNPAKALRGAPAPAPAAGEPTMADLMAEIRALRRLVEELMAR